MQHTTFADGHTASNAPDLFRPPKLSGAGPGQYWGGGPPGKPLGCCQLLLFPLCLRVSVCVQSCVLTWDRTWVTQKGLRDRNSPTCTLSQNGYGDKAVWLLQLQRTLRGSEGVRKLYSLCMCAR